MFESESEKNVQKMVEKEIARWGNDVIKTLEQRFQLDLQRMERRLLAEILRSAGGAIGEKVIGQKFLRSQAQLAVDLADNLRRVQKNM